MSRHATLREMWSVYDMRDLADFHEALDIEGYLAPDPPKPSRGGNRSR